MDERASEFVVALSTAPDEATAARIAETLVERRLAACVNVVVGVRSTYRWKGEVRRDDEVLLVIKTTRAEIAALKAAFPEVHPYEVPELVVLPVAGGSEAYLRWVAESVGR